MRIDNLISNLQDEKSNERFSCVHIYNPENKEVIHTSKTRMPANAQGVHLYLPDNGRDSL